MDTNETGREPTEPTDAELFDEWFADHVWDSRNPVEMGREAFIAGRLSGQRPMPDTPAPDEVGQLRAEVLRVTHAYEQVCMGIQKLRDAADLSTARVAELEAELAALRNGGQPVGARPFILTPDGKERKYWAGTKGPGATFLGKEPTSE